MTLTYEPLLSDPHSLEIKVMCGVAALNQARSTCEPMIENKRGATALMAAYVPLNDLYLNIEMPAVSLVLFCLCFILRPLVQYKSRWPHM